MSDYEYIVKEGDTLKSLSEAFYRDSELHPFLARHNSIKTGSVSVNQKIIMPRILMAGSKTKGNESILHLVYRSSSAVQGEGEIVQVYFEDSAGNKTEVTKPNQKVFLVVETKNLVGKKVNLDLADAKFDYEYNGKILENDILNDFEIAADTMKIELKSVPGRK
jgi:hypothetical protein